MAFTDRTPQFREIVAKSSLPDAKRRKTGKAAKRGRDESDEAQTLLNKEYMREAYNILNHINNLSRMLSSIRRAYLAVDSTSSSFLRQPSRALEFDGSEQSWSSIRHLTNEERDQIDMQARIILSKCADRVKQLEALDKKRAELASADTNLLTRLLPSRLKQDSSTNSVAGRAAHNSSVTYYLNRRLAQAGQMQKEMQEERIKRQMERTRTLGSGAAREAVSMGLGDLIPVPEPIPLAGSSSTRNWLGDAASNIASSIGLPSPSMSSTSPRPGGPTQPQPMDDEFDDDEDDDLELSASQIQQFESENANILRSVQDTLASVQQAEQRLMDISALQTELVTHLTKQSEITDQLYEDAISTTAAMEKGNEQLTEAKRRAKDSRLYILVFLVGTSLALLFLHNY
ncbi:uncharacterized protein FOMMEDRAFT_126341 [Fomitiporia mediterranea MF3/22]|uniref:uncharacterized protein n=1 Tax=Fomitiporia mediterranea (strain MF3/22) TaxID=694068 RepID=UPI0004408AAC|nr:uncharacterized protein FOMMEDRAFT_126341 [Fomitiporia mediterranea MF3/22]EJD01429.1 hypothetical protein FOMMEDRAFT_126341 [Fomitiporia mediterranea MF3/22]